MGCVHCSGGMSELRSVVLGEWPIRIKGWEYTLQTSHCYLERVNIAEAKEGFSGKLAAWHEALKAVIVRFSLILERQEISENKREAQL